MAGLKNVLIVEDDVLILDLYRSALVGSHKYTVEVAKNADELYQKLQSFHPDLIFLDIMLPGISGLEILKELRTNPVYGCTGTKIVILTNLAQRSVTDNAIANGADGYIIKADILPKDLVVVAESMDRDQPTN